VIAVSKCDLVARDVAGAAADACAALLARNGIAAAARVFTSAATGEGIATLAEALARVARAASPQRERGFFFLPADRVFAVPGFGTVATGTLRRGRLAVGDEVELFPGARRARVRRLQVHGRAVDAAGPGRRVAVNLRGVDRDELAPGATLVTPGVLAGSTWLDVELRLLASAPGPLGNGRPVRLLVGTTELGARVRLLDRDTLEPGDVAVAQLRCDTEVALPGREPFILRAASPPATIGGGRVLAPGAQRRRRLDDGVVSLLAARAGEEAETLVASEIARAGERGARVDELARLAGFAPALVRSLAKALGAELLGDGTVLAGDVAAALGERVLAYLAEFHRARPGEPGLTREAAAASFPGALSRGVAAELLAKLVDRGREGAACRRGARPGRGRPAWRGARRPRRATARRESPRRQLPA